MGLCLIIMVGQGSKPVAKVTTRVKAVKSIRKPPPKVQGSLDSYRISAQSITAANIAEDVDLEAVVESEGTE